MPGPELADDPEEQFEDEPEEMGPSPDAMAEEPEVFKADLGTEGDDIIAGFDGVEEDEEPEQEEEPMGEGFGGGGGGGRGAPSVEDAIEEGLAEVASVGLYGRERQQMQMEMRAVASKFKIGYFGREVGEKYLKRDLDNIPPEYGLAAALIAFTVVTLYKRPDGEQKVKQAVDAIKRQVGSEPEPEPEAGAEEDTEEDNE